jgi:hypothetical protein
MFATDPIDSLLAIYENPLPKNQARSNFDEDLMALDHHLRTFLQTHSSIVTDRNQTALIIEGMTLLGLIEGYFYLLNQKTGRGN